jgi:ubiquitin-protein ligase
MKFNTKINLPSVNQANGKIEGCGTLKNWKPQHTIETVLQDLKKEMLTNKKLVQPAEGASY